MKREIGWITYVRFVKTPGDFGCKQKWQIGRKYELHDFYEGKKTPRHWVNLPSLKEREKGWMKGKRKGSGGRKKANNLWFLIFVLFLLSFQVYKVRGYGKVVWLCLRMCRVQKELQTVSMVLISWQTEMKIVAEIWNAQLNQNEKNNLKKNRGVENVVSYQR